MQRTLSANRSTQLFLAALALGYSADLLFYGKSLGISLLLFVLLFVGALIYLGRTAGVPFTRNNRWLLLPLLFFAGMVAIRANPFLTALNVLAVLALLSYLLVYYAAGHLKEMGLATTLILPLYTLGKSLISAGPVVAENVNEHAGRWQSRVSLLPFIRGGLLAFPVLLVFTILLASADLVFGDRIESFFTLDFIAEMVRLTWRLFLILMVSWLVAGGLAMALDRKHPAETLGHHLAKLHRPFALGFVESTIILVLISLLFLAFVAFQFHYLFGGEANVNLAGYTYAEYARRGFFELVTVAVMSLGLILGLDWLTWRESKQQLRLFKLLSSLMIALVLLMLASAFQRMRLYEAAYGYTELRLYVIVFIIWLAVLLIWFVLTLWRWPDRFAIGMFLVAAGYLATLNLLNPDAFIVRQNLARYQASGDLDAAYLVRLSADAVPGLYRSLAEVQGDGQPVISPSCNPYWAAENEEECMTTLSGILFEDLLDRYSDMQSDSDWRRWQSFHLSRQRAYQLLLAGMG
ncbi:MAG: DUF4173 domain-containing protein [Chloroflexota bacterium]|jgi:hypothetical protein